MIQGQITWFEIPVEDLDRSIKFYSEVLNIKIEKNNKSMAYLTRKLIQ